MKWYIGIFTAVFTIASCTEGAKTELGTIVQEALERAYFEGQIDAIRGDVRVKQNSDGCWEWIKSPWDDSKKSVKFKPVCY